MKGKIKKNIPRQKILFHLFKYGKFKRFKEIESSNIRINEEVRKMVNEGILKYQDGYYSFSDKHPELKEVMKLYQHCKSDLHKLSGVNLDEHKDIIPFITAEESEKHMKRWREVKEKLSKK